MPKSQCSQKQGRCPAARDALRLAAAMLEAGDNSKEDYDKWRYHYPEFDAPQKRAKVMSQRLSDLLVEAQKSPNISEE